MDSLAKAYWLERINQPRPTHSEIMGEYWPVYIDGTKVHSALRETLYKEIYRKNMAMHWEKKDRMRQEHSILINWEACAEAMKRLKISCRHWVAKHTKVMCGVGKWLYIWQDRDTDECPQCSAFEDAKHVWRCPATDAVMVRAAGMERLSQWMSETLTAPEIQQIILTCLNQWFDNMPFTLITMTMDGPEDVR
jgi:hypothetical protein